VRLSSATVNDYAIVAPTEWNFHPEGAFAQDMCGLKETDARGLQQLAHVEALSLDPCVAYDVEIRHA
jgi:uptake hydrogenase large subunit